MNLIPWRNKRQDSDVDSPGGLATIDRLRSEMERVFDRFFEDPWGSLQLPLTQAMGGWMPAVDISESDDEVCIRAEIPGVDPNDLDVNVTENMLTIRGEKKETREHKGRDSYRSERRFGSFKRVLQLPAYVDPDQVSADYQNGILTVHLKKNPKVMPRRVQVKSSPELSQS